MKNGHNRPVLEKLRLATYAQGLTANICWSPNTKARIRESAGHHVHLFYEVVFIESGSGSHVINGEVVRVSPGDLTLFAPGSAHNPAQLDGARVWVLLFGIHGFDTHGWDGAIHTSKPQALGAAQLLLRALHAEKMQFLKFQIPPRDRERISSLLQHIEDEASARSNIGVEQVVSAHLNLILVDLLRRWMQRSRGATLQVHPTVGRAMDFIDTNFRRALSLSDIARHVGRSPAYLTNLIKQYTGLSAMAWLADRRLTEARNLILTSREGIQQISEEVGYESARHFSQMFKRRYGNTPMNWRNRIVE